MMMSTASPEAPRIKMAGTSDRQTQPFRYPYGVIPRREFGRGLGLERGAGSSEFLRCAHDNPLRLLNLLADVHPSVGLALWNALRLTCGEGAAQIVAVKKKRDSQSIDDDATNSLSDLWESLPSEIGGLPGLMGQLTIQALLTGLVCVEGVPGPRGTGVSEVWPVESLTIHFHRDPSTTRIMPLQRQLFIKKPESTYAGFAQLSIDTFFWRSIDAMVDEPYGRAPYAPAVTEMLADLALTQDLRDAVHNGAWPRLGHGVNFTELYKIATEIMGLSDTGVEKRATDWVNARFASIVAVVSDLKADDNIFYDSAGDMKMIEAGQALRAVEPILEYLRQRIVQSLKTLPTLMGINDGATQTYTTVEWAIYAAGLQAIQGIVLGVICKVASLHLRLMGKNLVAIAKTQPIRTTDDMLEAQAEGLRIANEKEKVRLGWISNEEAAVNITGSGPVADPMPGVYGVAPAVDPAAQPDPVVPDETKDQAA